MFTIVMYNSLGCELDRKEGSDPAELLRDYADEGCLDYGDRLVILSEDTDDGSQSVAIHEASGDWA